MAIVVPLFFAIGAGLHWAMARFAITPFNSLLVTFGITGHRRGADPGDLDGRLPEDGGRLGAPQVQARAVVRAGARARDARAGGGRLGRHLVGAPLDRSRQGAARRGRDAPIAAAFGVHQARNAILLAGFCAALAALSGVCLALTFELAPSHIYSRIGVVFAAVMLGGLARPLGPLVAGIGIGVSEAVTMAVTAPSWAPIVSFTLLIVALLFRPGRAA
jgi:branched-chain amino acid transport system permease protein